jgi:hypothetical protein
MDSTQGGILVESTRTDLPQIMKSKEIGTRITLRNTEQSAPIFGVNGTVD